MYQVYSLMYYEDCNHIKFVTIHDKTNHIVNKLFWLKVTIKHGFGLLLEKWSTIVQKPRRIEQSIA